MTLTDSNDISFVSYALFHIPLTNFLHESHNFRYEDYLQTPLQPLTDNLDTNTYSVFELDPVKYAQYQKAIAQALTDVREKMKKDCINVSYK